MLLFIFAALAAAQTSLPLNFTVTFSRAELSTCGSENEGLGLAFSTRNVPDRFTCFNLDDIFGQNFTSGVRNTTEPPLSWVVRNGEEFDTAANYSRIIYRQGNATVEAGGDASRVLTVYNGRQCLQTGENASTGVEPWFAWSCQSEGIGDCYTLPYNIRSFAINTRANVADGVDCWTFAYNGDAARSVVKGRTIVAALAVLIFVFG